MVMADFYPCSLPGRQLAYEMTDAGYILKGGRQFIRHSPAICYIRIRHHETYAAASSIRTVSFGRHGRSVAGPGNTTKRRSRSRAHFLPTSRISPGLRLVGYWLILAAKRLFYRLRSATLKEGT